jgi:hypothetical protein
MWVWQVQGLAVDFLDQGSGIGESGHSREKDGERRGGPNWIGSQRGTTQQRVLDEVGMMDGADGLRERALQDA